MGCLRPRRTPSGDSDRDDAARGIRVRRQPARGDLPRGPQWARRALRGGLRGGARRPSRHGQRNAGQTPGPSGRRATHGYEPGPQHVDCADTRHARFPPALPYGNAGRWHLPLAVPRIRLDGWCHRDGILRLSCIGFHRADDGVFSDESQAARHVLCATRRRGLRRSGRGRAHPARGPGRQSREGEGWHGPPCDADEGSRTTAAASEDVAGRCDRVSVGRRATRGDARVAADSQEGVGSRGA